MQAENRTGFEQTFGYKVIYAFTIHDEVHKGLVKVGDATIHTNSPLEQLSPDCKELNKAAIKRIKGYTNTAGVIPFLLYTELAIKNSEGFQLPFRDYEVHRVLENSGFPKAKINGSTGREWYRVKVETVRDAIQAVKKGYFNLSNTKSDKPVPIIFRPEQEEAIKKTVKQFKKGDRMLWNAKMRFGKTLCALEVVKECGFKKAIILTHRPVVNAGWYEDFTKIFYDTDYIYGSKANGYDVDALNKTGKNFVYFASIQDLRGSEKVGGNFSKNEAIFDTTWDLVIVDEAHEGTQTALGDETIKAVVKEKQKKTKILALSGTPFNIMDEYDEDSIYTWDYIMEQEAKYTWDQCHFGDSNPYEDLPDMKIYTYDLGNLLHKSYNSFEDKAFNFHEFFRTWTGDYKQDYAVMPATAKIGDFVHEEDVRAFLNLLVKKDKKSAYPYSTEEYRDLFRHSLWMVPGVREAKALKELMLNHPVFGSGSFTIVNVAGNDDEESANALDSVRDAIREAERQKNYTITISCGKLTTGVTIPEWTAVFMLSGSYSTSPASYLQTIFRVQSPCKKDGKIKEKAYVFDFAPDRTLKMVAKAVSVSSQAGRTTEGDRVILGRFLNYCPVISISGSQMKEYQVDSLLQQLKKIYAERVVRNGFDDVKLYSNKLLNLNDLDVKMFQKLRGIVGKSKVKQNTKDIIINAQGLTDEEYEEAGRIKGKPARELTEEEKALQEKWKEQQKNRRNAISLLRSISIRMPLLIYGADVPYEEDITLDQFIEKVDDSSWKEFMPTGMTKAFFQGLKKFYDKDIFVAAGRRVRDIAREADELNPTERIQKLASLFKTFKNPDKETVLTPWRVVNLHMSETLGGYDFWDEKHERELKEPRFVARGQVTAETLANTSAHILEINSKTGLYPLYVTYSIYRAKCSSYDQKELTLEKERAIWNDTIQRNIFIICKTPMAKQITQRTLSGYSGVKINASYFRNLITYLEKKPKDFINKIQKRSYWEKGGKGKMKFDAVVGNPPYQEERAKKVSSTNGQAPSRNVFQYFQMVSDEITSGAVSLIYPGGRWIHRAGKNMKDFGLKQINDVTLEKVDFYADSNDIFKGVAIADGISIVYKNKNKKKPGFQYVYHDGADVLSTYINNPGEDLIPLNPRNEAIVNKVNQFVEKNNLQWLHSRIFPRTLYGIESSFVEDHPELVRKYKDGEILGPNEIKLFANDKAGKSGRSHWYVIDRSEIVSNQDKIDEWQVVVSSANAGGQKRDNQIEIIDNHSAFGRSRVALGSFMTFEEASNFYNYMNTYLVKFMFLMTDEALTTVGKKVPDLIDYRSSNKLIDFTQDLNEQLYKLVNLSEEEVSYIKNKIINLRK